MCGLGRIMKLRPYQRAAIDGLYQWFYGNANGNPLLVLPTGAGKSLIIAKLIQEIFERWPGQRVLMLTHVKELIQQNHDKLLAVWPECPVGIYSAGLRRKDIFEPVIFASIQSVHKKAMQIGRFDLILIDECHLVSPERQGMYRNFIAAARRINPNIRVIGLTATAFRTASGDITHGDNALFSDIAYEIDVLELIKEGYLSRVISKRMKSEVDTSGLHTRQGEFIPKEVDELMDDEEVTRAALDEVEAFSDGRKAWLVFCSSVAHAEHVKDAMLARGIPTGCVTGSTPAAERDKTIADYRAGKLKAIANCNVLTTGFDAPETDLLIMLRPTKSPGLYVQCIGRGMRVAPGKENCLVLDFSGNVIRHGPIDKVKPWRPKAKGDERKGVAPDKTCPNCQSIVGISLRECPDCGHIFLTEQLVKHEATANDASLLSDEIALRRYRVCNVSGVRYFRHRKPGRPQSMRVDYFDGLKKIASEWICLEHEGYAQHKAHLWWKHRADKAGMEAKAPDTVGEALMYAHMLARPTQITVNTTKRYPEIVSYGRDYVSPT